MDQPSLSAAAIGALAAGWIARAAPPEDRCYQRDALAIAQRNGCRVALVHNGNDGPGRVWETVAELLGGGWSLPEGFEISGVVHPDGRIVLGRHSADGAPGPGAWEVPSPRPKEG